MEELDMKDAQYVYLRLCLGFFFNYKNRGIANTTFMQKLKA